MESISRYLARRTGVPCYPGDRTRCPVCHAVSVRVSPQDDTAHCVSHACGIVFRAPSGASSMARQALYEEAHPRIHCDQSPARRVLAKDNIHPAVIAHSLVGECPPDWDEAPYYMEDIAALEAQIAATQVKQPGRPKKQEGPTAELELAGLRGEQADLRKAVSGRGGSLMNFYTDAGGSISGFEIVNPEDGASTFYGAEHGSGVFGATIMRSAQTSNGSAVRNRTIVCGSARDVLSVQSTAARAADAENLSPETSYRSVVGVRPYNPDGLTLRAIAPNSPCVHVGPRGVAERGLERLRAYLTVRTFETPAGATLRATLATAGDPDAQLQWLEQRLATTELKARCAADVRRDCDLYRDSKAAKPYWINRSVSDIVLHDLQQIGRFFHNGEDAYLFLEETRQLLRIDPDDLEALLAARFGLARSDDAFRAVVDALRLAGQEHGTKSEVFIHAHYDKDQGTLYVFDHDRHVYQITSAGTERVVNGTNGILFWRSPHASPFEVDLAAANAPLPTSLDGDPLHTELLESVEFQDGRPSKADQCFLFFIWTLSLFFLTLMKTRPIATNIGPKGSGKSLLFRALGQLLFGPKFDVTPISNDQKDVQASLTNDAFLVLDNADKRVGWLDDMLAVTSTGGRVKRRLYYTTNTVVDYIIRAVVAITSRTPHFRREDVADRLLIFRLKRRYGNFPPETEFLDRLQKMRNSIMTALLCQLRRVVAALGDNAGQVQTTAFRMADFANFALVAASAFGQQERMQTILKQLEHQQTAFALQDNPLVEFLDAWLENPTHHGAEHTSAQLFAGFKTVASNRDLPLPYDSTQALAQALSSNWATLESIYAAKYREVGGRKCYYMFMPAADPSADTPAKVRFMVELDSDDDLGFPFTSMLPSDHPVRERLAGDRSGDGRSESRRAPVSPPSSEADDEEAA